MSIQKYTLAANAGGTAVNITNDKNDLVFAIFGNVNLSVIQRPILVGGTGFSYTVSATTGAGSITNGGSGYPNGTFTNVRLSGGTGAGAKYTIVVSAGVVTTVTKTTNSTTNYTSGDVLSLQGLPQGYDTIVVTSSANTPNQGLQSFSMPTNTISVIDGVDVTAYTTAQLMNAINSICNISSSAPAVSHAAIVINTPFTKCRGVYVGVGGDVSAVVNSVTVVYKNAATGSVLPIQATNITTSGTTATNLVALY